MTTAVLPENGSDKRLGRSVTRIHQAEAGIPRAFRPDVETLIVAGNAMDFIARVHGFKGKLATASIDVYSRQAQISKNSLSSLVLPALKRANVADFTEHEGQITGVEDFLGVTGNLIEQSYRVLQELRPSREEYVVLNSVEIGSFSPLTQTQHLDQLVRRGFSAEESEHGYKLSRAANLNRRIKSANLGDYVTYNPYVWETQQIPIASFLANLPSSERDALLGIVQQAATTPGLALPRVSGTTPQILSAARKVGLVQAATVKSTSGGLAQQTYVFSPASEAEDDRLVTSESLNMRKLFVAHILFGHQKAGLEGGRIMDPIVLTGALLNRGRVGPASNIATDYHLLETHGIVTVEPGAGDRAYLNLVKDEIVRGGLAWLKSSGTIDIGGEPNLKLLRSPSAFSNPESDRQGLSEDPAAMEIAEAAVLKLREEAQSATRQDKPFGNW